MVLWCWLNIQSFPLSEQKSASVLGFQIYKTVLRFKFIVVSARTTYQIVLDEIITFWGILGELLHAVEPRPQRRRQRVKRPEKMVCNRETVEIIMQQYLQKVLVLTISNM